MRQADPDLIEWGDIALAAQAAGALKPAWKTFIKARFFVPILRSPDDDPRNFLLDVTRDADGAHAALRISEVRERLGLQGDGTVALSGADILRRLEAQAGIEVALDESVFSISAKRADWLRSGIEVTKKRVITRKILQEAAPAAPLPVLHVQPAADPDAAPVAPAAPAAAPALFRKRIVKPALGALALIGIVAALGVALRKAPPAATAPSRTFEAALPPPTAVVAAPAASAAGAAPAKAAVTFTAAYQIFTVQLPGLAEEIEQAPDQAGRLDGVEMHRYRLQADGLMYTMEASVYRGAPPQAGSAGLDAAQAAVVGQGTLIRARPLTLHGAAGREVRVRLASGGERAARFVFAGDKFCMVMVTAPAGAHATAQMDAFLNSFRLK